MVDLARDAQSFTAGHEHDRSRATSQEPIGQLSAGIEQMLRVVEQQQLPSRRDAFDQGFREILPRLFLHAQRLGHGLNDQGRVCKWGQLHQADTVRKFIDRRRGDVQREPCLTAAACAGQGE